MGYRLQPTENDNLVATLDLLAAERIYAIRINTVTYEIDGRVVQAHSGGKGVADVLAFPKLVVRVALVGGPGPPFVMAVPQPLWIETKSATGRQRKEQKSFEERVTAQGHYYLLLHSIEDLYAWLGSHEHSSL